MLNEFNLKLISGSIVSILLLNLLFLNSFETIALPDTIQVCRTKSGKVATVSFEEYVKGVVSCDKKGKINYYFPVLKQDEYAIDETENLLTKIYKGSVKNLVATLYENKKLSKEDVSDLKKMFELE